MNVYKFVAKCHRGTLKPHAKRANYVTQFTRMELKNPVRNLRTHYFAKNHYDRLYREFYSFLHKYHGIDDSVTSTAIDPISYKHLYPIIVYFYSYGHALFAIKCKIIE